MCTDCRYFGSALKHLFGVLIFLDFQVKGNTTGSNHFINSMVNESTVLHLVGILYALKLNVVCWLFEGQIAVRLPSKVHFCQ